MTGKYTNWPTYLRAVARRSLLRSFLSPLVSWPRGEGSMQGYTVIVGCFSRLPELALANLRFLGRQDCDGLAEVLLVFDQRYGNPDLVQVERTARERYSHLACRFLYYTAAQELVTRAVRWPWVNSWLSWCIGIRETRTRYAVLHDLDAMPLSRRFLRDRYERIRQGHEKYLGLRYYVGNGIEVGDRLVTTFELFFDAAWVRRSFRPLDLFNRILLRNGRSMDLDTFLYPQMVTGSGAVREATVDDLVHPSQLICQLGYLLAGDRRLTHSHHSLALIPYLVDVGGRPDMMRQATQALLGGADSFELLGCQVGVRRLARAHVQWIIEQMLRLEHGLWGHVRPEVQEYVRALRAATSDE